MRRILEEGARFRELLKQRPQLAYLFFEVTSRCNLKCLHCGSSCTPHGSDRERLPGHACAGQSGPAETPPSSPPAQADMPASYISAVLDSIERALPAYDKLPLLCITGGEPLLYPGLCDVMALAAKRGFSWGMTTNATLINNELARRLFDVGLITVTVSVDGLEGSHDWFRGTPGSFALMKRGLGALIKQAPKGARVDVITVVNRRNIAELPELYCRLKDSGIRSWRITNMEPIGRARQNADLMLDRDEMIRLLDFVKELHLTSPSILVDYGCSHYLTPAYERTARPYCFTCIAGLQVASVAANGDIVACLDIERRGDLVQGNVQTDDFWDVWQNGFELFRGDRSAKSATCSACSDKLYCAGDSAHTWDYDRNEPMLCVKKMLEKEDERWQ